MSAGPFQTVGYETNDGNVVPIRIQPETLALTLAATANAAPAGAILAGWPSAQVGQGKRSLGINARTVTFRFTDGNAPAGYKNLSPITLPVLQDGVWAAYKKGDLGTYQGAPIEFVGKNNEKIN